MAKIPSALHSLDLETHSCINTHFPIPYTLSALRNTHMGSQHSPRLPRKAGGAGRGTQTLKLKETREAAGRELEIEVDQVADEGDLVDEQIVQTQVAGRAIAA